MHIQKLIAVMALAGAVAAGIAVTRNVTRSAQREFCNHLSRMYEYCKSGSNYSITYKSTYADPAVEKSETAIYTRHGKDWRVDFLPDKPGTHGIVSRDKPVSYASVDDKPYFYHSWGTGMVLTAHSEYGVVGECPEGFLINTPFSTSASINSTDFINHYTSADYYENVESEGTGEFAGHECRMFAAEYTPQRNYTLKLRLCFPTDLDYPGIPIYVEWKSRLLTEIHEAISIRRKSGPVIPQDLLPRHGVTRKPEPFRHVETYE